MQTAEQMTYAEWQTFSKSIMQTWSSDGHSADNKVPIHIAWGIRRLHQLRGVKSHAHGSLHRSAYFYKHNKQGIMVQAGE